jgi:DNA-directed RNA polymerase subunit M/transcription elongation factor TFIIS
MCDLVLKLHPMGWMEIIMFCPNCGNLAYPSIDGTISCPKPSCQFSGMATIPSAIFRVEKDAFERVGGPGDAWDEPEIRLQSTSSRTCRKCASNKVKIVGNDLECQKCGADVC